MQIKPVPLTSEEKILLKARLLNKAEQAIVAIDLAGRIVFWNRCAETFYDRTADDVND